MVLAAHRRPIILECGPEDFRKLGATIIQHARLDKSTGSSGTFKHDHWLAHFGVSEVVCADAWGCLALTEKYARPLHFLWALLFLKNYIVEEVAASSVGAGHEQTFRKWTDFFVREIASLCTDIVSVAFLGCCSCICSCSVLVLTKFIFRLFGGIEKLGTKAMTA